MNFAEPQDMPTPIEMEPATGKALQDLHEDGVLGPSRAAKAFGVMHMLSSVAKPGLEEVAKVVPDYPKFFQLYVRGDAEKLIFLLV